MPDISVLIPVLLLIRVVLDVITLASKNRSYRFEFAYFLIFLTCAIVMLNSKPFSKWGALSFGIALFSLIQFFCKRVQRND
ncbi:MAG TPA: hypothetical protein PK129_15110 [Cellvibrionaceae bacterium]|nr:hypothetical protein [Cellvibrionaceae bacterium]